MEVDRGFISLAYDVLLGRCFNEAEKNHWRSMGAPEILRRIMDSEEFLSELIRSAKPIRLTRLPPSDESLITIQRFMDTTRAALLVPYVISCADIHFLGAFQRSNLPYFDGDSIATYLNALGEFGEKNNSWRVRSDDIYCTNQLFEAWLALAPRAGRCKLALHLVNSNFDLNVLTQDRKSAVQLSAVDMQEVSAMSANGSGGQSFFLQGGYAL